VEVEAAEEHQEAGARQGEVPEADLVAGREGSAVVRGVAVASAVEVEVHREGVAEDDRGGPRVTVRMAHGVHGAGGCTMNRCIIVLEL
jgi:hypothetical protein